MTGNKVNIFWTGGWDSTFRLIQLLVIEKKSVQPYYIVKPWPAVGYEVKAMTDIRRQIFRKYPNTKDLLQPTRYIDIREIEEDKEVSYYFKKINETFFLANQYQFLARFCKQNSIENMELCIEDDVGEKSGIFAFIDQNLDKKTNSLPKLKSKSVDNTLQNAVFELFKYYHFPIFYITKTEMGKYAVKHGFMDIMYVTWFCATPWNGKPCGFCSPCLDAIKAGLSKRIPYTRRFISYLHLPLRNFYRKLQNKH